MFRFQSINENFTYLQESVWFPQVEKKSPVNRAGDRKASSTRCEGIAVESKDSTARASAERASEERAGAERGGGQPPPAPGKPQDTTGTVLK